VALNTLDVLVHQLPSEVNQACAVMDAQRQQFFAACYQRQDNSNWAMTQPCHIVEQRQLLEHLPRDVFLTGPGMLKVPDHLQANLSVADRDAWAPQAATVGQLAWRRHVDGCYDDLWALKPEYYRPSYAEEKRRL
jgi:tRNA A37 threonylcarbamoyladenosine modification protein TsaB